MSTVRFGIGDIAELVAAYRDEDYARLVADVGNRLERGVYLRLPRWLDDELRHVAEDAGLTRQEVIRALVFEAVGR